MADFAKRIAAGEDAVADGRAAAALAITDDLRAAGCRDAAMFLIEARALALTDRVALALSVLAEGMILNPSSGRLGVEQGKILTRLSRPVEAEAAFDAALSADPRQMEALKGLLALHPLSPDDPRLAGARALGADDSRPPNRRAKAHYVLGQVYLDAGQLDNGFAHYRRANDLMGEGQDPKSMEYRLPPGSLDITRALLAAHPRQTLLPPCPGLPVVGLPRSGKTLAESLLARTGAVTAGGELATLSRFARGLDWAAGTTTVVAGLAARTDSPVAAAYAQVADGRRFVTDTSPPTLLRLGVLAALHPDAPMVLCRRDPLDLMAAMYFKQFRRGNLFTTRLDTLGRAVARAEHVMAHWSKHLPNPMVDLAYEDMVQDSQGAARRLAALIGAAAPADLGTAQAPARLHPTQAAHGAPTPALIGFACPLARHFGPAMDAYAQERRWLHDHAPL